MIHSFSFYIKIDEIAFANMLSIYKVGKVGLDNVRIKIKQINRDLDKQFFGIKISYIKELLNNEFQLHVKVDVLKLLSQGTIREADYSTVKRHIQGFLSYSFGSHINFEQHTLIRIDYKFDAVLSNEKERELLLHLINKHTNRYSYKEKIRWGKGDNGTPIKYESSQYHNNKSVGLIIYDKEKERVSKGEPILSYQKNIIRYELRLQNQHLNSKKRISKSGQSVPKKLAFYFKEQKWYDYMVKHVIPIVHTGDYYKISEAEKIINQSALSKHKKEKLRGFLIQISRGSLDTPKRTLSKGTYRQYLRDLESLNINPILIPKNRKDYPCYLKNPLTLQ